MSDKWDGWADPLRVACPKCAAPKGRRCTSATYRAISAHADRRWIAEDTKNDAPAIDRAVRLP